MAGYDEAIDRATSRGGVVVVVVVVVVEKERRPAGLYWTGRRGPGSQDPCKKLGLEESGV